MYAALGEFIFQTLESPESFESARAFHYAKHDVVEGRPRLQWMANDLETISLELMFHAAFVNPKTQLDRLTAAADDHQARALVFANGVHRGYFVIASIAETHHQAADDGSLIWASAKVELKEWALGSEVDPQAPPRPKTPPPAIIKAPAGTAAGTAAGFNPNQPIGPHNLMPTSAILALGSLPAGSYQPPGYSTPGVSPIVNNPAAAGPSGPNVLADDIPPQQIVS